MWENIKVDLKEIGYEDVYWIHLTKDGVQCRALVKTETEFQVP